MAVVVDRDFVRVGSKSYALNKINSIDVRDRPAPKRGRALWLFFGWFTAIGGLVMLAGSPEKVMALGTMIVGVVIAALAMRARKRARRTIYSLYLMTSSGEVQAVETMDLEEMQQLRDRIEAGMAALG